MSSYRSSFQIFTPEQIASLRIGGKILQTCLEHVADLVRPGITTHELDIAAENFIRSHKGALPAFKGYMGYPGTLCTSVNDEIVHAIPGPRILKEGDIVSLDGGVIYDKLYTDACITVGVGRIGVEVQDFLDCAAATLEDVVREVVRAGVHIGDISSFIQKHLQKGGYSAVRALTGHGLGDTLHQYPDVPNVGKACTGPVLPVGTMIAIEPIATMGNPQVKTDSDGWTIRTVDASFACHFEHSVVITETGCEIIA